MYLLIYVFKIYDNRTYGYLNRQKYTQVQVYKKYKRKRKNMQKHKEIIQMQRTAQTENIITVHKIQNSKRLLKIKKWL